MPVPDEKSRLSGPVQVLISGSGGQGIILIAIILAAAALEEGHQVVQTQAYGPEARGGASRAEVIISPEIIGYPHVDQPDVFLALTQEAFNKYVSSISENAFVMVDSLLVENIPNLPVKVHKLPIVSTAKNELGKEMVSNMIALGALNSAVNLVSWDALEAAVLKRVPASTAEINKKALSTGRALFENRLLTNSELRSQHSE